MGSYTKEEIEAFSGRIDHTRDVLSIKTEDEYLSGRVFLGGLLMDGTSALAARLEAEGKDHETIKRYVRGALTMREKTLEAIFPTRHLSH